MQIKLVVVVVVVVVCACIVWECVAPLHSRHITISSNFESMDKIFECDHSNESC